MSRRLALQRSASGKGEAAAVRQCGGAAEGLSGPALRFEPHIGRRGEISTGFLQPASGAQSARRNPTTETMAPLQRYRGRGEPLDDRTAELEAAIRAQDAVIAEAQRLLADCQRPGGLSRDALIEELRKLFDGPPQRDAQRLSREALGEDFGNNA
jgi:hypothetical protein